MVKKHLIALFLNTGIGSSPVWTRVKKSTELTISMNPSTEEYNYIADENSTTELDKYAPSIDQDLTMYRDQPDYEFAFKRFFEMSTGADAHVECMVVFMQEGDKEEGFKAWKTDAVMSINDLNAVDSKINFALAFGGTVDKGVAVMADGVPTFSIAV